jgi:hypothetical protein
VTVAQLIITINELSARTTNQQQLTSFDWKKVPPKIASISFKCLVECLQKISSSQKIECTTINKKLYEMNIFVVLHKSTHDKTQAVQKNEK